MRWPGLFDWSLLKFIIIGIANTLLGSAVMFAMYNLLYCSQWVSFSANYIVGSILSFFLNKHFTFQNQNKNISVVIKFILDIVVCYLLAYGIAKPVVYYLLQNSSQKVQDNLSMLVGMIFFVGFNYIGQRFFAFADQEEGKSYGKRRQQSQTYIVYGDPLLQ